MLYIPIFFVLVVILNASISLGYAWYDRSKRWLNKNTKINENIQPHYSLNSNTTTLHDLYSTSALCFKQMTHEFVSRHYKGMSNRFVLLTSSQCTAKQIHGVNIFTWPHRKVMKPLSSSRLLTTSLDGILCLNILISFLNWKLN